jgi:hypothetical protein
MLKDAGEHVSDILSAKFMDISRQVSPDSQLGASVSRELWCMNQE